MKNVLFILTIFLTKILSANHSDPYINAVFGNDPSLNVEGVNIITGDFSQSTVGIYVHGTEPIDLKMFYSTRMRGEDHGGSWMLHHNIAEGHFKDYGRISIVEP